jgi:hypothetical protein
MAQRYNKQINYEKMLQKNSLKFEHLKPSSIFQPEIWALLLNLPQNVVFFATFCGNFCHMKMLIYNKLCHTFAAS